MNKSIPAITPINSLFDRRPKHWSQTSVEQLHSVIESEAQQQLFYFVVESVKTYVFHELDVRVSEHDTASIIDSYLSCCKGSKLESFGDTYKMSFYITYNKKRGERAKRVTSPKPSLSESLPYIHHTYALHRSDNRKDDDRTIIDRHFQFQDLAGFLKWIYQFVRDLLLLNQELIDQLVYCNNIVFLDLENEHISKLVSTALYQSRNRIYDDQDESSMLDGLKERLLIELNRPKVQVIKDLERAFEDEKARLEILEKQESQAKKQELVNAKNTNNVIESEINMKEEEAQEGKESGAELEYYSDTFENEEISSKEFEKLFEKFRKNIRNLPSEKANEVWKPVTKMEVKTAKHKLETFIESIRMRGERIQNEEVRKKEEIFRNIKVKHQEYRSHILEKKMKQAQASKYHKMYTESIKCDIHERLQLSENIEAESIPGQWQWIKSTLALSQVNATNKEYPILSSIRAFLKDAEGRTGKYDQGWMELLSSMMIQFCNYKILLQENVYKIYGLFQSKQFVGKNIFDCMLRHRNSGRTMGQLGMKDPDKNELPIQKLIRVYSSSAADSNVENKKRLYLLIQQMLDASPEGVLLCPEVYKFLTPKILECFFARCHNFRNVLDQRDANGNTPTFLAVDNLEFRSNAPNYNENRAILKYMLNGETSETPNVTIAAYVLRLLDYQTGDTLLHRAVRNEKVYAVEEILKSARAVNFDIKRTRNFDGFTALQVNTESSKESHAVSVISRKIHQILSGEKELEALLKRKIMRKNIAEVNVPLSDDGIYINGFLLSELLQEDKKERHVIFKIDGRRIVWKKQSDSSILPENLHKFETIKSRMINAVRQIECTLPFLLITYISFTNFCHS